MFGLGPLEILVILAAFVIFVGPDKIPEVTKQVARFFVQAKRMSSDVKNVVDDAIRDAEREIEVKEIKHLISDLDTKAEVAADQANLGGTEQDACQDPENELKKLDEAILSEDGVPNTSVNMNSSIDRQDPFGDTVDDESLDKKSE